MLTRRLMTLVDGGLLEKRLYSERPPRYEYILTSRGYDLSPVLTTLLTWGNKHFAPEGPSIQLADLETGHIAEPVVIDKVTGHADWGWLFLGAGVFSWLALESLIIQRLWHRQSMPVAQRPLVGIQFAPPVVCSMASLILMPGSTAPWLLMLWGYGLFQLLVGIRLTRWLGAQAFAPSYWAYTFGIAATTVSGLKLALAGVDSAQKLAIPIFIIANLFIGYLTIRTVIGFARKTG